LGTEFGDAEFGDGVVFMLFLFNKSQIYVSDNFLFSHTKAVDTLVAYFLLLGQHPLKLGHLILPSADPVLTVIKKFISS